jgi:hypothetical protein
MSGEDAAVTDARKVESIDFVENRSMARRGVAPRTNPSIFMAVLAASRRAL